MVLTTYALLQRDIETLAAQEWQMAVLDEAQAIKNPRSKGAQAAGRLRAEQRLALTGTPMENHLEELWSVFSFAVPGLLGERTAFGRAFRTPIEKRGDTERRRVLASRLRPFLLRRTKELVARDLPEKSEIVTRIELDGAQRDLYETIRIAMHKRVRDALRLRGLARSRIVVLDALLKLRQVCCDPRLVKMTAAQSVREVGQARRVAGDGSRADRRRAGGSCSFRSSPRCSISSNRSCRNARLSLSSCAAKPAIARRRCGDFSLERCRSSSSA